MEISAKMYEAVISEGMSDLGRILEGLSNLNPRDPEDNLEIQANLGLVNATIGTLIAYAILGLTAQTRENHESASKALETAIDSVRSL